MSETSPIQLVTGKTDADLAQEFRAEAQPLLDAWAALVTKVHAQGFQIGFNMTPDSFGKRFRINEISIVKPL